MEISIGGHAITIITMACLCRFSSFFLVLKMGFLATVRGSIPLARSTGRKEKTKMKKNNIRGKISQFLKSEEGRVGVKSPLALGVASASVLVAQAMVTPSAQAHLTCIPFSDDCGEGKYCAVWCDEWSAGTCIGEWHSQCEVL